MYCYCGYTAVQRVLLQRCDPAGCFPEKSGAVCYCSTHSYADGILYVPFVLSHVPWKIPWYARTGTSFTRKPGSHDHTVDRAGHSFGGWWIDWDPGNIYAWRRQTG